MLSVARGRRGRQSVIGGRTTPARTRGGGTAERRRKGEESHTDGEARHDRSFDDLATAAPAVAGDAALAVMRDGTDGSDPLVGTHRAGQDDGGR